MSEEAQQKAMDYAPLFMAMAGHKGRISIAEACSLAQRLGAERVVTEQGQLDLEAPRE